MYLRIALFLITILCLPSYAFPVGNGGAPRFCPEELSNDMSLLRASFSDRKVTKHTGFLMPDGSGNFKTCSRGQVPTVLAGSYRCVLKKDSLLSMDVYDQPIGLPSSVLLAVSNKYCNYFIFVE